MKSSDLSYLKLPEGQNSLMNSPKKLHDLAGNIYKPKKGFALD